nr:hypothetical protein [Tanacetum cinerariifolium]
MPTTRQSMSSEAIKELIAQRVANALLTYETNQNTRNGNGNRNINGNGSQSDRGTISRGTVHTAHGCTYKELLNYQPFKFKGTKGVLALLCPKMVSDEEKKVKRYIRSLPDNIQGNVTSARPVRLQDILKLAARPVRLQNAIKLAAGQERLQDAVKLANSLMDLEVRVFDARQIKNKRRLENNPRDNHEQQPPLKRKIWQGSTLLGLVKRVDMLGGKIGFDCYSAYSNGEEEDVTVGTLGF